MKRRTKTTTMQANEKPEQMGAQPIPPAPTPEQIQKRAYEIFQARDGTPGREWDDWLLAEQQLRAELGLRPQADPAAPSRVTRSTPSLGRSRSPTSSDPQPKTLKQGF
jgi:hypothetical protein